MPKSEARKKDRIADFYKGNYRIRNWTFDPNSDATKGKTWQRN